MKIMELEERKKCMGALVRWFESQNIGFGDASIIMMEMSAVIIGVLAPSANEVEIGMKFFAEDSKAIALRSYSMNK